MQPKITDPVIAIGTLARKCGLSVSAIRKYETEGLIIPFRTDSGHRLFSYEDLDRIKAIQHLIKHLGFNIEGIRRMQSLLPCWDLLPCSQQERDACPAFRDNSRPCWMMNNAHCSIQGNECRLCNVYRFGSLCAGDIKELLHNQTGGGDLHQAVRNLLMRKNLSLD